MNLKSVNKKRLEFIDVIRSIAIIMMLEGHFITLSLQPNFKTDENPIYLFWRLSRGITAPLFFSISGLIFTYLLLKNKTQGWYNPRVKKGLKRTSLLIVIGYLLQLNLYYFLLKNRPLISSYSQIFHVLQCIGTSLFILILIYLITFYIIKIPLGVMLLLTGLFILIVSPSLYEINYNNIPKIIENALIISKDTTTINSIFPLFPWSAYVFLGGSIGSLVYKIKGYAYHFMFPVFLIYTGISFRQVFFYIFKNLQSLPFFNTLESFKHQYQTDRFCQVLIFIGCVILIQKMIIKIKEKVSFKKYKSLLYGLLAIGFLSSCYLFTQNLTSVLLQIITYNLFFIPLIILLWRLANWNYQTFLKIGQNTLSVYVWHVILIYRGFFGFKLNTYFKNQLNPFYAILSAILFVFLLIAYAQYKHLLTFRIKRFLIIYKVLKRKTQYKTSTI